MFASPDAWHFGLETLRGGFLFLEKWRPFPIRNFDDLELAMMGFEQLYGARAVSEDGCELVEFSNAIIRYEKSIAHQLVEEVSRIGPVLDRFQDAGLYLDDLVLTGAAFFSARVLAS